MATVSILSTITTIFRSFCVTLFGFYLLCGGPLKAQRKSPGFSRDYIQIRVYHAADTAQLATISQYLQQSLLPALEKTGIKKIGVFTAIDNDTASDKRLYVFMPFQSLDQVEQLNTVSDKAAADSLTASGYTKALYNQPLYSRFETILVKSFETAPMVKPSEVKGVLSERVYELRSYESATEAIHQNKVLMFNSGEVDIFQRLGFNAVFYAQVIAGSHMPNLMYMTSFESKAARDEHWKAFGGDPAWKALSAQAKFKNNVSKIDIVFLRPMAYSRL